MTETALVEHETQALATTQPATLLPVFRGKEMAEALTAYRELQAALDSAMPDQIIDIHGRAFRKKGYWRAIATAFALNVSCVSEESDETGWRVVYRARAANGRSADGDGACSHDEKAEGQDTEHNVRSHAHTRAFNRAVSNLVGFGEVSAEEVRHDGARHESAPLQPPQVDVPDDGRTYITRVDVSKTNNPKVARYLVTFSSGRAYSTINDKLGKQCQLFRDSRTPVDYETEKSGKWTNLTSIIPVFADADAEVL